MLTGCEAGAVTPSVREAVKVAVPVKPAVSVTVYVTVFVACPPVTVTEATPVPGVAAQL